MDACFQSASVFEFSPDGILRSQDLSVFKATWAKEESGQLLPTRTGRILMCVTGIPVTSMGGGHGQMPPRAWWIMSPFHGEGGAIKVCVGWEVGQCDPQRPGVWVMGEKRVPMEQKRPHWTSGPLLGLGTPMPYPVIQQRPSAQVLHGN